MTENITFPQLCWYAVINWILISCHLFYSAGSCQGRCNAFSGEGPCYCDFACIAKMDCCEDYTTHCRHHVNTLWLVIFVKVIRVVLQDEVKETTNTSFHIIIIYINWLLSFPSSPYFLDTAQYNQRLYGDFWLVLFTEVIHHVFKIVHQIINNISLLFSQQTELSTWPVKSTQQTEERYPSDLVNFLLLNENVFK